MVSSLTNVTDIDAEVRYAVRNEYAQTAVDVISRRLRLSFLNAQATLDALPRVVDIMAEELHWDETRKRKEIEQAVDFLSTMGLSPAVLEPAPRRIWDKILWPAAPSALVPKPVVVYSRAQFEAGEVEALRLAFSGRAYAVAGPDGEEMRLKKDELAEVLRDMPVYEGISVKDYEYALDEAGFQGWESLDFDEFLEVSGSELFVMN